MTEETKISLQKAALIGRGVAVFLVLLILLGGLFWGGYHRHANVAVRAGEPDDPLSRIRLVETNQVYIRLYELDEDSIASPVDQIMGEVKPEFPTDWSRNYVIEHIEDEEELLYVTVDGKRVLYYAEGISPKRLEMLQTASE